MRRARFTVGAAWGLLAVTASVGCASHNAAASRAALAATGSMSAARLAGASGKGKSAHEPELIGGDHVPSPDRVRQRQAEAVYVGRRTAGKALTVDNHRLRPERHYVASEGDDRLDDRLHATYAWARPDVASRTPEGRCLGTHAGRHPRPPEWGSRDGAVQPARRARGEIHMQSEAKDRGNPCARERNADDSQSACPTVRAATPNLRCDGAETTKYPTGGVLHDFARCDEDFRRA